jgi:hypothetical protein
MYYFSSNRLRKKAKFSNRSSHNINYLLNLAILPHGVNSGELVLVRPPWGWSTGFIATPLTDGLFPHKTLRPAFPITCLLLKILEDLPKVTMQLDVIVIFLDEGNRILEIFFSESFDKSMQYVPADRAYLPPELGWSSKLKKIDLDSMFFKKTWDPIL